MVPKPGSLLWGNACSQSGRETMTLFMETCWSESHGSFQNVVREEWSIPGQNEPQKHGSVDWKDEC